MTVKMEDAAREAKRLRMLRPGKKKPRTMAHAAAIRFYRKHLRQNKKGPSLIERATRLKSIFQAGEFLKEIAGLDLAEKKRAQLRETVRVRVAELKGLIP